MYFCSDWTACMHVNRINRESLPRNHPQRHTTHNTRKKKKKRNTHWLKTVTFSKSDCTYKARQERKQRPTGLQIAVPPSEQSVPGLVVVVRMSLRAGPLQGERTSVRCSMQSGDWSVTVRVPHGHRLGLSGPGENDGSTGADVPSVGRGSPSSRSPV